MPMPMQLDQWQRAVAGHRRGPLLLYAGAGSGKTRVLSCRFAGLVQDGLAAPTDIMAITFTRDAAAVMHERIQALLGQDLETKNISTIHSACYRILGLGRRRRPKVAAPDEAYELFQRAMLEVGLSLERWDAPVLYAQVCSLKENLILAETFEPVAGSFLQENLAQVYNRYQAVLADEGKVDFGDLILEAIRRLYGDADFLGFIRNLIPWVMVDEFQDTSLSQWEFVRLLAGSEPGNLLAVGSPAQSIHEWRGASYSVVRDAFTHDYPEGQQTTLRVNYRCAANIVQAATAVGWGYPDADQVTDRDVGVPLQLWRPSNQYEEAGRVAHYILSLLQQGVSPTSIAILYRTHRQAHVFESQLGASGVPYVMSGTPRLYKRSEVTHLLTYLRLATEVSPEASVESIVNAPPRGLGPNSVLRLKRGHPVLTLEVLKAAATGPNGDLPPRVTSAAASLVGQLHAITARSAEGVPPSEVVDFTLDVTGYRDWTLDLLDGYGRVRALEQVRDDATGFDRMADFLQHAGRKEAETAHTGVTLSTIHGAKGCEWPVVIVAGVTEGLIPHAKAVKQAAEPEEERRLMYVALTRAMDRLVLSAPTAAVTERGTREVRPSRYLRLIPAELLQEV